MVAAIPATLRTMLCISTDFIIYHQSLHACTWFIVCKHDFPFPGVGAASSGKLTFMVGGAEEEFTAAKELLSCMGANVVYCGQVGTGQV